MTDQWIVIRNWTKHQHYKDKLVPWIKFYTELLHDEAYLSLTGDQRSILHGLWLEYASSRAQLPLNTRSLSSRLRLRVTRAQLETLNHAGFIEFSSSPNLDHVYMGSSPRALAKREREKENSPEFSLPPSTSPTTRDDDAPRSLTERASSRKPAEEPEVKNGQPERPAYDVVRDLIRNGGHNYTDDALIDEMDAQARRRNTPITQPQRDELLELANTIRQAAAA